MLDPFLNVQIIFTEREFTTNNDIYIVEKNIKWFNFLDCFRKFNGILRFIHTNLIPAKVKKKSTREFSNNFKFLVFKA